MKIAFAVLIAILTVLAISSGITKILLLPQDVEFFGRYGFSNSVLIAFGVVQLVGGILLPFKKTRFTAAAIVASTFLASLAILLMDGNIPLSIVTLIATLLLFAVMRMSWRADS